jgi:hypothetical protein
MGVRMAQKCSDFADRMTAFHKAIRASVAQRVGAVAQRGDPVLDEQPAYTQINRIVPEWRVRRHKGREKRRAL